MTERFGQIEGRASVAEPEEADAAAHRAALTDVLGRLTAPIVPCADGRRLDAAPGQEALHALLDEIDSTVMARSLRVSGPDGAALHLEVSNRRLLHVAQTPQNDALSDDGHIGLGALGFAGLDDLNRLLGLLGDLCAAGPITIEALAPSGTVGVEQTGVSVATLREAIAASPGEEASDPVVPANAKPGSAPAQQAGSVDADAAAALRQNAEQERAADDTVAARAEAAAAAAARAAETVSAAANAAYADAVASGPASSVSAAPGLPDFAILCGADALCWQSSNGESGGAAELQEPLEEVWELWPEGLLAQTQDPLVTILSPVSQSGAPLLLAQIGEDALAMLLVPSSEARVTGMWLRFLSSSHDPSRRPSQQAT
ncbi:MAG: hypothetical protein AAGB05_06500 [Pseudomonadota bacterium]